jgi:hypothetical protein
MKDPNRSVLALFRFHLKVGARVAMRVLAPAAGFFLFIYYVLRPEFSVFLTRVLLFENGLLISGSTLAMVGLLSARVTAARVLLGESGWIRHLPMTSSGHRRLAVLGATVAGLPILAIAAFLVALAARSEGRSSLWMTASLPFLGLASALFWTPVKNRRAARSLAFLACLLFGAGYAPLFATGILALAAADRAAGPLRRGGRVSLFVPRGERPGLAALIALRAVGWKFAPYYLLSFVFLILSRLFILNNRPSACLAASALRFGGTLSIVFFLAFLASALAARRPPWPWFRSLPTSARSRVAADALFMGIPCLSLVAVVTFLNFSAGLFVLACLPGLAVRAAAVMRRSPELRTGPALAILIEGGLLALVLALSPWASLVALAAVLPALRAAARSEQKVKVSRWSELHHLAAGDSQSWSST